MFKYILLLSAVLVLAQCNPYGQDRYAPHNYFQDESNDNTESPSELENKTESSSEAESSRKKTTPEPSESTSTTVQPPSESTTAKSGNSTPSTWNKKKATLGQVIDHLGQAAKDTVIEEKESIANAIKSAKAAAKQTVKAGLAAVKSKFDIFMFLPKFGLNALGLNRGKPNEDKPTERS